MKVLITGVAGFIGSYLARALIWRGDDVVGIDNFIDYYPRECKEWNLDLINLAAGQNKQFITDLELPIVFEKLKSYFNKPISSTPGGFIFLGGDITNLEFLQKLFIEHQFDAVIHLAAMAGVPLSIKNPLSYVRVNVEGTTNLLKLTTEHQINKFLFASSSSVYGNREDNCVKEEDDVTKTASIYGATKVAGEVLCHSFNQCFGLKILVIRIFGPVYGPLQRPYGMFHQRAINYIHNNKTLQIYGRNGLNTAKDATYIDDEVDGFMACLDQDNAASKNYFEIFNLGTANPLPIKVWLDAVNKAYGKQVDLEIVDVDKSDVVSSADITKAKNILNYSPKVNLYEGVDRQVEVFKLMPKWYRELNGV